MLGERSITSPVDCQKGEQCTLSCLCNLPVCDWPTKTLEIKVPTATLFYLKPAGTYFQK